MVFVSVRGRDGGPRTRRKRALGLDDDATWESFVQLVCARLSLRGVKAVYTSSGAQLRSLDEVQDIEDLEVEESEEALSGASPAPVTRKTAQVRRGGVHTPDPPRSAHASPQHAALPPSVPAGGVGGDEDKYAKRGGVLPSHLLARLPSWAGAAPSKLNAALKDAGELLRESTSFNKRKPSKGKGRKLSDPTTLLLIIAFFSCTGTMLLLYSKLRAARRLAPQGLHAPDAIPDAS